jgi:hypothetical protein
MASLAGIETEFLTLDFESRSLNIVRWIEADDKPAFPFLDRKSHNDRDAGVFLSPGLFQADSSGWVAIPVPNEYHGMQVRNRFSQKENGAPCGQGIGLCWLLVEMAVRSYSDRLGETLDRGPGEFFTFGRLRYPLPVVDEY